MTTPVKLEVNRYAFLFAIYWFTLVFSTTQILGRAGLLIPVFLGALIFLSYAKIILYTRTVAVYFIMAIFAFWMSALLFKRTGGDTIATLTSTLLIISNFGIAYLLTLFEKRKMYPIVLFANVAAALYVITMRILGFSVLESISLVFRTSSYHLVAWLLFILNSISILALAKKGEKAKIMKLSLTLLIILVVLQGRSGIFMGFFILLCTCWIYYRKYFIYAVLLGGILALSSGVSFSPESLSFISADLYERGANLGPREVLYGCYYTNLNWTHLVFGFNKTAVAGDCIAIFDPTIVGATESSILSLISEVGLFSIILLAILIRHMKKSHSGNPMFLPIVVSLLFRVISADYLFSTVYDWFVYYIAFAYLLEYANNPEREDEVALAV